MGKELAQKITGGKLSWGTRLSYASGDVACNVVFGMIGTLLTLFYTDYVGISPATVGLMMLLSRLFDGVSDLIMGVIVERTNSKWGKSRPWILWMSCTLCFVGSSAVHSAAYHRNASVPLSVRNL